MKLYSISYKFCLSIISILIGLFGHLTLSAKGFDWSQSGKPISEHFDTTEISDNPQNFAIKQDDKGFIYVGNGAGILVYDGVRWDKISYGNHPFRNFDFSDDGKIYTGTTGEIGFFRSDIEGKWRFTSLSSGLKGLPHISGVYKVLVDGSNVYFTTGTHFFYYNPKDGLKWLSQEIAILDLVVEDDKLLISTIGKKLYRFDLQTLDLELLVEEIFINSFKTLDDDNIIASSFKSLLYRDRTNSSDNSIYFVPFVTEIDEWLSDKVIIDIVQLSNKTLAIGTLQNGVALLSENGKLLRLFNHNHGLDNNNISSLLVDRENSLWISSYANGVTRAELNSPVSIFQSNTQHLLSNTTTTFRERTFLGAVDGIFELEPVLSPSEQAEFKKLDINVEGVLSFLTDENELLFGHFDGIGILKYDNPVGYKAEMLHDGSLGKGHDVGQIIRSKKRPDFAYATSRDGLIELKKNNGKWKSNGLLPKIKDSLYSIKEDQKGNLWLGTQNGFYYHIEQLDRWPEVKIKKIGEPQSQPPSVASLFSLGSHTLFDNRVDGHLSSLSGEGENLTKTPLIDWTKYKVNSIEFLLEDSNGLGWFITQKNEIDRSRFGLLELNKNKHYNINYSYLDHLNFQFVTGINETDFGILWINNKDKIIRFDTSIKKNDTTLFKPILSKIEQIGSSQTLYCNNGFEDSDDKILLQPEQNALRFFYSSTNFAHANTVEYRTRMRGYEHEWSKWTNKTSLEVANLEPGTHKLDLQYRINPNLLSPILSVELERLPFWYEAWWGHLLMLITLLSLILFFGVLFAISRNKKLARHAKLLKRQVYQRTQTIQQQYDQLKEMDEAKSRFFANISHEFRTPLSLIIGPLKAVLSARKTTDVQNRYHIKVALKNCQHMMDLIGQVLDLSKLEEKNMPVKVVKIYLAANLRYCIQRFESLAKEKNITFKMVGFDSDLNIYIDSDHFEKIIVNLICNAIKYSPTNSDIEVGIKAGGQAAIVWVKDFGFGIAEEELPHIFDRFYQGKMSSQVTHPGTGIGLGLVKELVELHQAKIQVKSSVGEGSCFTVEFKLKNQHFNPLVVNQYECEVASPNIEIEPPDELLDSENDEESRSSRQNALRTILIIDDNDELRQFMHSILINQYLILEANNGVSGFELAIKEQPDVIISDVMMPEMDGFQLAEKLKSTLETDYIPLILLTAKSRKVDTVHGLQQGADDYLTKPFDSCELVARIEAQIARTNRMANHIIEKYRLQNKGYSPEVSNSSVELPCVEDKFRKELILLIEQRLDDPTFDIEQMVKAMHVTRSTLYREIKKRFDCTPKQLLKTKRLEIALQMLRNNNGTISEVAYAVGFHSLSNFSRVFSEHYKFPPTHFKEITA